MLRLLWPMMPGIRSHQADPVEGAKGRNDQIQMVTDRLALRGATTLIVGAAGIGKSTVIESALTVHDASVSVHRASASDLQMNVPFATIADLANSGSRLQTVEEEISSVAASDSPLDPYANVLRLADTLVDALTVASPVALVVDDLHWMDPPSLTVLDRVLPALDDAGTSLLMAMRPDPRADLASFVSRAGRGNLETITLEALDRESSFAIVRDLQPDLDDTQVEEIARDAAGNPLFLTEAARSAGIGETSSYGLRSSILARLGHLPEESMRALRVAAVSGSEVNIDLVAKLLDLANIDLIERLRPLMDAGLIVEAGRGFEFRHALVRQALIAELPASARRELHRQIASHVSDEVSVTHLELAGAPFDSAAISLIAGQAWKLIRIDGQRSAQLFELAIAHSDHETRDQLRPGYVRALIHAGELERARSEMSRVTRQVDEIDVGLALLEIQGAIDEPAPDLVERLWELASQNLDADQLRATRSLVAYHALRADPARFASYIGQLGESGVPPSPATRVDELLAGSILAGVNGDLEEAIRLAEGANKLADEESVGPSGLIRAALTLGVFGGDLAPTRPIAIEALDSAARIAEESGHAQMVPSVHAIRANALWADADWEEAEVAYRTSATTAGDVGVSRWEAESYAALCHIHADRGLPQIATEFMTACRRLVGDSHVAGVGRGWVSFDALKARVAWGSGDDETAISAWLNDLNNPAALPFAVAVSGLDVTAAALAADETAVLQTVARGLKPFAGGGPPVGLVIPLVEAALSSDNASAAEAAETGRLAPAYGFAKSAEIAGLIALRTGETERAVQWLTEARETWLRCGAGGLLLRVDQILAGLGVIPASQAQERPVSGWGTLTDAEEKVVRLVAGGLLYREVADELYVSRRTVETHVASLLRKLGLRNRGELAAEYWKRANN